jgi:Ca2+-binding RTX toxin-like protein
MTDTYIGDNGVDSVPSTDSWTKLYGIGGNDTLATDFNGLALLDGGDGDDYLWTSWDAALTNADFYGGNGNDYIEGGASEFADYIYAGQGDDYVLQNPDGAGSSDYIEGGQGRDALRGAGGDDEIYGGGGDDSGSSITAGPNGSSVSASPGLFGGDGDDYLDGGRGNDLLVGGLGFDVQVGGPGNDIFDFDSADESVKGSLRDLILDFKKGDKIDLSDIGTGLDFIGKQGFHGEAGEIRFKKGVLQADFDGNGKAEFEIKLDGVTKLKDADLLL